MVSSTGNYSGASSHPPSLYDTSISSTSAGNTGSRNTSAHSRHERDQLRFLSPSKYPNNYYHQEKDHHRYPKSTRSIDNPEYKFSSDIAAMSDPGGTLFEQDHNQYRSQVEYARPRSTRSSSSFHEPQHQHRMSRQHFQEKRHRKTKNEYSPATFRRNSVSPPLEQQRAKSNARGSNNYSRDTRSSDRDNTFARMNEGYHDSMYASSPSYNERSLDSSSSTFAVNVREFQKQLWNNNQTLKVPVASSTQYSRPSQQSLSPIRHPRRQRPTSPNNLPRYARSLSPRRRQYRNSSSSAGDIHLPVQKANSTISDSSYNNRFHSKFYEAALVAQTRADGNKKAATEINAHRSQKQMQKYIQQHEQHRLSPLSRPSNQNDWNEYLHQNRREKTYMSSPSQVHNASNRSNNAESNMKVAEYLRKNDASANMSIDQVGNSTYRNRIIPPSPLSSSSSPTALSNERQEIDEHKQRASVGRGGETYLARFRSSDGINARRIRPPSPLLLDRIRSFDHEYYNDSAQGFSGGKEQGNKTVVDRRDGHFKNHNLHPMHHHDIVNSDSNQGMIRDNHTGTLYVESNEGMRNKHLVAPTNGRIRNDRSNFNKAKIETNIIDHDVQEESHRRQLQGFENIADNIGKDRMVNLVDKLSAVNRENPVSALAQIDSILRKESQSAHVKKIKSDRDHEDTRDHQSPGSSKNHTEKKIIQGPFEDDEGVDLASNQYDDDDESSDVSSITNPTFQQGVPRSYYSNQINQLYIRENDHYNMHTATLKSNIGERNSGDFNKLAYNPSTSSFRRPRPSHLQNYSKDVSNDQNIMRHSEWKKDQLKKKPPPSTIKVKDDSSKNKYDGQNSADFREKMLQKNTRNARTDKHENFLIEQRTSMDVHGKPKKNLDKFVADKKGLAEKIRGWDELSNQLSTSRSEHEENATSHEIFGAFPKRHPWDNEVNLVQTKDTSMDNAIGIEAEISTHPHESSMCRRTIKNDVESSKESSGVSNERKGNHFVKARRNIKDRSEWDYFEEKASDSNEYKKNRKDQYPRAVASDHSNANEIPIIATSMSGIPQFNPSEENPPVHKDEDLSEMKPNINGTSSLAMPPSISFRDIDDNFEPRMNTNMREPNNRSKSIVITGQDAGIHEVTTGVNNLNIQNKDGVSEFRSISRIACKTNPNKEPRPKEKKRGFLRAFMEKKKTKAPSDGYAASATVGSVSARSNSIESRGVKSASHIHPNTRQEESVPSINLHFLPPPPGVLDPIDASTKKDNRGRAVYRSASTSRSKSSEKFRSSSMAKKFNRVMELYNSDEI